MAYNSTITRAMRDGYPSFPADPKTGMRPGYMEAAAADGINHWAPRSPYEMEGRVYLQYTNLLSMGWRPVLAAEAPCPAWGLLGWLHQPTADRLKAAAEGMRTQRDACGVKYAVFDGSFTVAVYGAEPDGATLELGTHASVVQPTEGLCGHVYNYAPPQPPQTVQMGEVQGYTYGIVVPRDVEAGLQPITTGMVRYACPDGATGMAVPITGPDGANECRVLPQGLGALLEAIVEGMDEEKTAKNRQSPLVRDTGLL